MNAEASLAPKPAAQSQGQQGFQEQDALAEAEALRGGNGGAMSGGAIAAVVGGALLLIVLIVLCLCTLWMCCDCAEELFQRCCCCVRKSDPWDETEAYKGPYVKWG